MAAKVREFLQSITVEPVLFIYTVGGALYGNVYSQLIEEHICRQLDAYSVEVCANLSAHPHEEAIVRGQWAVWGFYAGAIQILPGIIFALVVAPWSDTYGRKWMMLSPPAFAVIAALQLLANVYWPTLPTWQLLLVMITDSVSGGGLGLMTACMSYAADVTDKGATRTIRIAMLEVSMSIGFGVGSVISAALYRYVGPAANFLGYLLCSIFNVLYISYRVKETRKAPPMTTIKHRLKALVDIDSLRRIYAVVMRKRDDNRQRQLHVWLAALFFYVMFSCAWVGLPFLEFAPFYWSLSFVMIFYAFTTYYNTAFLLFVFPLVKRRIKVRDGTLTVIGLVVNIGVHAFYFYARSSLFLILASIINPLNATIISLRALLSRTVGEDEQGCVFAVVSIVEKATPLVGGYAFSRMFQATAATMPSAIFGAGALLLTVPMALFAWADVIDRRAGMIDE